MDIVERLREHTALKYMGDCKCGNCQLVPRPMVDEAADDIERLLALVKAQEALTRNANDESERLRAALRWYEDQARYISEKLHGKEVGKDAHAIEASLVALALDGGERARRALEEK